MYLRSMLSRLGWPMHCNMPTFCHGTLTSKERGASAGWDEGRAKVGTFLSSPPREQHSRPMHRLEHGRLEAARFHDT